MERDKTGSKVLYSCYYFNSRAHVERDYHSFLGSRPLSSFQLTRSRGARLICPEYPTQLISFQLTRSRGARLYSVFDKIVDDVFQLTRSRGARQGHKSA